METIRIESKDGASAEIHPHGATVVSWIPSGSTYNRLFVSSSAKLDGSKAIRGGIPLVFPQFGQPDKSYPQHGFLRNNLWTLDDHQTTSDDGAASAQLSLELKTVVNSRGDTGPWSAAETKYDCKAVLKVTVKADTMTTSLTLTNLKGEALKFPFQTLFHTYYKVKDGKALDGAECNVVGLAGYENDDKISNEVSTAGEGPIVIDGNVDRVYNPPPGDKAQCEVTIATGAGTSVSLKAFGTIDGKEHPVSCVVWNPYKEKAKAMSDFTDEQYVDMICVEPGLLQNVPELESECVFTQVMQAM